MDEERGAGFAAPQRVKARAGAGAQIDWAAVRLAYEESADTVVGIRRRFGVSEWRFRARRERENWRTRPAAAEPGPRSGQWPENPALVSARLCRLLAGQIATLERRNEGSGELQDRDVRRVLLMARALETMMRANRTSKSGGATAPKNRPDGTKAHGRTDAGSGCGSESGFGPGSDPRGDPAWARAELKRRLATLRGAAGLPGED